MALTRYYFEISKQANHPISVGTPPKPIGGLVIRKPKKWSRPYANYYYTK
jgi:hypothetical protein